MFRISHYSQQFSKETVESYLVHGAIIGKELEKYRLEMTELDPKNLYQTENHEIIMGSCFKCLTGNPKVSELTTVTTENVV